MDEKPNYYAVIPANVRYDKRLKLLSRMIYGEIAALSNTNGYCWATNKYFAELYDVTVQTISGCVNQLKEYGYIEIKIEYVKDSKQIEKRIISLIPIKENLNSPIKENLNSPIKENLKENNTRNNNTSNNIYISPIKNEKTKKLDPYINPICDTFKKEYISIMGTNPYLMSNQRQKIVELNTEIEDFAVTIPIVLEKLKSLEFKGLGFDFTPNAFWLLEGDNYGKLLSGVYDKRLTDWDKYKMEKRKEEKEKGNG